MGCCVDAVSLDEAVRRTTELARGSNSSLVVTLGTEMVVRAQSDERFRSVINGSALSLCDTVGVMLGARLNGVAIAERVTGIDLLDPLCGALSREGLGVYLIGGHGDTAARAAEALRLRHPSLIVSGTRDGYFSADQNAAVTASIARSGARVLLAGLGFPRQELWLADQLALTGCAVGIGVGGSFDVLAGNVVRAPAAWRASNLEWLYRLVCEPRRWRRQLALPAFVLLLLRDAANARFARRLAS